MLSLPWTGSTAGIDWANTRGLNEFERKALELTEEIGRRRVR